MFFGKLNELRQILEEQLFYVTKNYFTPEERTFSIKFDFHQKIYLDKNES